VIIILAMIGAVAGSLTPIESNVSGVTKALSGAIGAIFCGSTSVCGLGFSARWLNVRGATASETVFFWLFLIVVLIGAIIGGVIAAFAWDRNVESL
jgi:hypothetical protein